MTTSKINRRALTGSALAVLALLFLAAIVLSNTLLRGARLDFTQHGLYTLSDGTKKVLAAIPEPINLYFFFSDHATENMPALRTYANRVRELTEEMAAKSGGKIRLKVIDPLSFSEEEDRASGFGLQAVPVGQTGETLYFGLAGTNSTDGQAVIPFFQIDKESLLEYDLAKLIHTLSTTKKPVVGLISSLNMGPGFDQGTRQMKEGWAWLNSLNEFFEVRQIQPGATKAIDKDIETLVVVHPKGWSEELDYAIDQFVLRGGRLLLFLDPNAEQDQEAADPENPSAAMFASKASDLPKLLKAWGVEYDPNQVVLDAKHALTVQTNTGRPSRHPAILGFARADLNNSDVITASLDTINLSSAGQIKMAEKAPLKLTALIQTGEQSMLTDAQRIRFLPDPSSLLNDFKASGDTYVLAGRLEGKLKTAFPERSGAEHLAESKDPAQIVIVADTDVLSDRLWVQAQPFFGQTVYSAFANNGDFAINAVDNLTGSNDLISVRGRASAQRPFTKVAELRQAADDRFRAKENELKTELAETERKLGELQRGKSAEQALILSPEQRKELDRFQAQKLSIRKELRGVRRQLDADIESLGTRLKVINIVLLPLLLTVAAILYAMRRRSRRATLS
jgi:ABC-type uncharacterized transport system involved in gliding motility auxiliary subunit